MGVTNYFFNLDRREVCYTDLTRGVTGEETQPRPPSEQGSQVWSPEMWKSFKEEESDPNPWLPRTPHPALKSRSRGPVPKRARGTGPDWFSSFVYGGAPGSLLGHPCFYTEEEANRGGHECRVLHAPREGPGIPTSDPGQGGSAPTPPPCPPRPQPLGQDPDKHHLLVGKSAPPGGGPWPV